MKRSIITCLILIAGLNICASPISKQVKDSLLRALNTQPHDSTRLQTLHSLARLDQTNPTFIYYENLLLKEAINQKNIKYQCIAMHNHILYYYNHNDEPRAKYWMARLSDIAPKNGYYDLYFDAKRWLIELYFLREEVEWGIYEAQKMETEAVQHNNAHGQMVANLCMMSGYIGTLQIDKALKATNKAKSLLSPNEEPLNRINSLLRIVAVYAFVGEYDKVKENLIDLEKAYNDITPALQGSYPNVMLSIESHYVNYFLYKNNLEEARKHLEVMDKYYRPNFYLPAKVDRLNAYAEFYRYNKEYDKALATRDSIIQLVKDYFPNEVTLQDIKIANTLIDAGRMSEALPLYKRAVVQNDSINRTVSRKQMEQIQDIYNVDKLLLEKEKLKTTIQIIILSVIGTILLLSMLFTTQFYRSRRKLKQAEQETREATRITEETNEVKSRFLSNMSFNIRIPLNNVVGFSQLIAMDPNIDDEMLKEYSKIIQKNASELIQLVNDVLDLSRLESGMMRYNLTDYSIHEICNDAIGQVRMKEPYIQVAFANELPDCSVHTDIARFSQLIVSLLGYPVLCEKPRRIAFSLKEDRGAYTFKIQNSPLADPEFATQIVAVRHEINRLLVEHFGGKYEIKVQTAEGPTVIFTIPVTKTSKMTE